MSDFRIVLGPFLPPRGVKFCHQEFRKDKFPRKEKVREGKVLCIIHFGQCHTYYSLHVHNNSKKMCFNIGEGDRLSGKEKASAFVSGLQSFRREQETVGIKIPHLLKNNYNSIHFYFSLSKSIEDIFNHSDGVSGKLYQCLLFTFCKLPKNK